MQREEDVPGDLHVSSNGIVRLQSIMPGVQSIWLRSYSLNGAPMGVSAPLYPRLLLNVDSLENGVQHIRKISDCQYTGFPLMISSANNTVEFQRPRLLATVRTNDLQRMNVQIMRETGQLVDPLGQPLFSDLVLDLIFSTRPAIHDPALDVLFGAKKQDTARRAL